MTENDILYLAEDGIWLDQDGKEEPLEVEEFRLLRPDTIDKYTREAKGFRQERIPIEGGEIEELEKTFKEALDDISYFFFKGGEMANFRLGDGSYHEITPENKPRFEFKGGHRPYFHIDGYRLLCGPRTVNYIEYRPPEEESTPSVTLFQYVGRKGYWSNPKSYSEVEGTVDPQRILQELRKIFETAPALNIAIKVFDMGLKIEIHKKDVDEAIERLGIWPAPYPGDEDDNHPKDTGEPEEEEKVSKTTTDNRKIYLEEESPETARLITNWESVLYNDKGLSIEAFNANLFDEEEDLYEIEESRRNPSTGKWETKWTDRQKSKPMLKSLRRFLKYTGAEATAYLEDGGKLTVTEEDITETLGDRIEEKEDDHYPWDWDKMKDLFDPEKMMTLLTRAVLEDKTRREELKFVELAIRPQDTEVIVRAEDDRELELWIRGDGFIGLSVNREPTVFNAAPLYNELKNFGFLI